MNKKTYVNEKIFITLAFIVTFIAILYKWVEIIY